MSVHNRFVSGEQWGGAAPPPVPSRAAIASTDEVDPRSRFDYWRHVLADRFGGTELRRHENGLEPFSCHLQCVQLGEVTLTRVAGCAAQVVRAARTRGDDPAARDRFHLEIPLTGTARLVQAGRETMLRPGDFALCDNGLPFRYGFPSSYDELVIQIRRDSLLSREPRADRLAAVPVRGDAGIGALLSLFLARAADLELWAASPVAADIAMHLVDLVVTALSAELGPPERRAARSRYLAEARAFLHDHLGDVELSPERVARAVGISPRYLHALFHDEGTTVTRYLTARRLERSRVLLGSDHHAALPITEIAASVGFRDLSHFSTSFKSAFGVAPRTYRRARLGDASEHEEPGTT